MHAFLLRFFYLFFAIFTAFVLVWHAPSFAGFYSVKAYDSIAGYGTEIKISNANANEKIKIFILPPSGELQTYLHTISNTGEGSFILAPEKTKQAGEYMVVVVEPDQNYSDGLAHSFEIFADDPSSEYSWTSATDTTIPSGVKGKISIQLMDAYQNPISGHRISLLSSSNNLKTTAIGSNSSNEKGQVAFWIQSNVSGDIRLQAYDETYGESIGEPIIVQIYNNALSGNLLGDTTNSATNQGVAKFSISFPETVPVHSDENYLSITALDANGKIVSDFTGSVIISIPSDKNAIIPAEKGIYTFTARDQGKVTFSRSLTFSKEGKHSLEIYFHNKATDETNYNIFGKKEITVEKKNTGIENPSGTIIIESPVSGSTISTSSLTIAGKGPKNSDLIIYLDNKNIKTVTSNELGKFSDMITGITNGKHELYAQQKNNTQIVSEKIPFEKSNEMGNIISASFSPQTATPKQIIEVQASLETGFTPSSIEVMINSVSHSLTKVKDGLYSASVPAPSIEGTYPVIISVQNSLGEIKEHTISQKLIVAKGISNTTLPQKITGVKVEYIPEKKVALLSWKATTPDPMLYIIHSGNTPQSLKKIKSVSGTTLSTEIEITEAQQKYFSVSAYFSISGVDANGNESEKSDPVLLQISASPTPTPTQPPIVTATPTANPVKTSVPTATPLPSFTLVPQENSIRVDWEKYPQANSYTVSYGITSKIYAGTQKALGHENSIALLDLIPGIQYYISIEAFDSTGKIIFPYGEKSASPLSPAFHAVAMGGPQPYPQWIAQTGPTLSLFLGGIFLLFSGFLLQRNMIPLSRRRNKKRLA